MAQVDWRGQKVEKWVAIELLKEHGFARTRTPARRDILYRYEGGESRTLTVVRIRQWSEIQVDLDSRVRWESTPENIRERAWQIGDDNEFTW